MCPLSWQRCPQAVKLCEPPDPNLCSDSMTEDWSPVWGAQLRGLPLPCPCCPCCLCHGARCHCLPRLFIRLKGQERTEAAVRPIGIASALLHTWHRALLRRFPALPADQHCGAPGTSAVFGCLAWLCAPVTPGSNSTCVRRLIVWFTTLPCVLATTVFRMVCASLLRCAWGSALQTGPGYVWVTGQ